jgi:FAD/FMN-containing dehydrogenase/Fe-S oxidoreductase
MPEIATNKVPWPNLARTLSGELCTDQLHRILYATDASVYRELPRAVAFPASEDDVLSCVRFAIKHQISITPRAGGTSLAGQAVGSGLIVDVSKFMTDILEINYEEGYAVVEPGVIRDQLNAALAPKGYWFGPNTSTANRCTLGGMFGNNSCGSTSITVGSTRDHTLEARVVLGDGTVHDFGAQPLESLDQKSFLREALSENPPAKKEEDVGSGRLFNIYKNLHDLLSAEDHRRALRAAFPKREVQRRNTGYALDLLAEQAPFSPEGPPLNLCTLLAGSEGTLAFTTRLKVRILPLPPAGTAVVALHFRTIDAAMRATQSTMTRRPFLCELMDDTILQLAKKNSDQAQNAAFVQDDPRALLLVEFRAEDDAAARGLAQNLISFLARQDKLEPPFAAPILVGKKSSQKVWALRAAGLGILGNMVGDAKAVACIEDTAVALPDLADYIQEFDQLMRLYQQHPVYYAHAGAGELHLRPVLNLKTSDGQRQFYEITRDVAQLVKKYRGSLSGEHGDGRVRAQFLKDQLGEEVYQMLVSLKQAWDPAGIFNPGKIVEAPPMNESLRYAADEPSPDYPTLLDFSEEGGLLAATEKCNGSGDCRKLTGGAMCPSYRATRSERDSTRGRANVLREILTQNQHEDPFTHPALAEAMDLCLSCKACTSECPSTVNMTALKSEYQYQLGKQRGHSLRSRLVAANEQLYRWGGKIPRLANTGLKLFGPIMKKIAGIASERSLPPFPQESLRSWYNRSQSEHFRNDQPTVFLFGDEFSNYQDVHAGKAVISLLRKLGYNVRWSKHAASGRAHLSKGFLEEARQLAARNVAHFRNLVSASTPLIGIEPSAILGFRDEYPKLLRGEASTQAGELSKNVFTFDEFLHRELEAGRLGPDDFGQKPAKLVLHVHCHEKALGRAARCAAALSLPPNFSVELLDSGCCGMAGSFGYEAEHFAVSKNIAEQSLLRHLRPRPKDTLVVAAGTSCRHQVKDLLGRRALHPAEALLASWDTE